MRNIFTGLAKITIAIAAIGCGELEISETVQEERHHPSPKADSVGESEASSLDIPYFWQYDNELHPSASCQNTSVAMVLKYSGWEGVPDDITREWGKDFAQSPESLNYLFNTISTDHFLRAALTTTTTGTLEGFREAVAGGSAVIVHGYFTSYGHVLVVNGIDSNGNYVVNDPAGLWSQEFKGGYLYDIDSSAADGDGIVYEKEAFEVAISTSDGQSHLPLWYHVLRQF